MGVPWFVYRWFDSRSSTNASSHLLSLFNFFFLLFLFFILGNLIQLDLTTLPHFSIAPVHSQLPHNQPSFSLKVAVCILLFFFFSTSSPQRNAYTQKNRIYTAYLNQPASALLLYWYSLTNLSMEAE